MFSIAGLNVNDLEFPQDIESFRKHFSLNSGNLLFHYATELITDISSVKYNWSLRGANRKNGCSGIVIPMANHIGVHVDLEKKGPALDEVDVPVVVLGLGAQFQQRDISSFKKIPDGTISWLKDVSQRSDSKNIALRGRFTYKLLERHGLSESVVVTGCQSNFINPNKKLGEHIFNKFSSMSREEIKRNFSVTAGSYSKKQFGDLERSLIELVSDADGEYVVQNPKSLISLANGWFEDVDEKEINKIISLWFPGFSKLELFDWFNKNASLYISVPQWLLSMSKKSIVVGTRIHGVQAALQAGTPGLCLCVDSRTKELCEFMAIPHLDANNYKDGISVDECMREFNKWDYLHYDKLRLHLARRMKNFLKDNGMEPSKHLLSLAI